MNERGTDAVLAQALALFNDQRWQAAADFFEQAAGVGSRQVEALLGLGSCLLHLSQAEEALVAFDRCLDIDSMLWPAREGRAASLHLLSRFEDAEYEYLELLRRDPGSEETLANLIHLGAAKGDLELIRRYAERLLAISPEAVAALHGLATVAFGQEDYDAAAEWCRRLLAIDPSSFEAGYNLKFAERRLAATARRGRTVALRAISGA